MGGKKHLPNSTGVGLCSFPSRETFGAMRYIHFIPSEKKLRKLSWAARSGLGFYQSLGSIWEDLYLGIAPKLGKVLWAPSIGIKTGFLWDSDWLEGAFNKKNLDLRVWKLRIEPEKKVYAVSEKHLLNRKTFNKSLWFYQQSVLPF